MPGVVKGKDFWGDLESNYSDFDLVDDQNPLSAVHPDMKGGSRPRFPNGYSSDQQSDVTDDGPRYLLEHLATFSVGPEYGLVTPKDGLRRLLQMEKTNGIWTQKMQMKLDKNWVIILDYEDGDVVEKFPMNLISDPTAYTSDDPRELYNNILVFIVREDPKNKNHNPSEMHIFQCARVYAQDVVDEMKMFITGKAKAKYSENMRHLPPPPHNPPPEPPINGNPSKINVREQVAMFSASAMSSSPPHPSHQRGSSGSQHRVERSERTMGYARESNDETSSTTSDKYEREVTILNHCFDDIERFVVRLQHAAAAYKELERRQKNRKHKKKDMGDGMLSIRAKPPPEREFIDILQKFKLSFNLLAKLKSHIHDPNAPELVHFLFTPLALIVDAARDSNHSANLAARVVNPLLTRDSVELLANCCTSKETDLWHSLGDSWVIPRDQWKGYEGSYHPVFSNGWAPENPLDDGGVVPHRLRRDEADLREQDYQRVFGHQERESRYGSEYFGSERGDDQERSESPGGISDPPHMRPAFDRQYDHRGSMLSPESDFHDPRDRDVRSEFSSDSIEHTDMPLNPQRQFDRQQMQWLEELKNRRAKVVQVVYPRTANNDKELTVIRGEVLEVLDDSRKWWKARNMRGQIAHVPHTIVTPYPSVDDDVFNNPLYATRSSRESYYSPGDSPVIKDHFIEEGPTRSQDVRPPMVLSPPAPADWVRRERQDTDVGNSNINEHWTGDVENSTVPGKYSVPIRSVKTDAGIQTDLPSPILPSPPQELYSDIQVSELQHSPPNWLPLPPNPHDDTSYHLSTPDARNTESKDNGRNTKEIGEKLINSMSNVLKSSVKSDVPFQQRSEPKLMKSPNLQHMLLNQDLQPVGDQQYHHSAQSSFPSTEIEKEKKKQPHNENVPLAFPMPKENKTLRDSIGSAQEQLHEELKATVAQNKGQRIWKKIGCPEHKKSECFYITHLSKPQEVSHWLNIKGFSERAQEVLKQMSGEMLFKSKKNQLEKYLDEEGTRLYSNLLIQKNICGFKTCSTQELNSILAERRQKIDIDS